jgi:flagellar biosynthetic protein FliQ
MNGAAAIDLIRAALLTTAHVAGPVVAVTLAMGLLLGVLQTATQVQEQSITFAGKLLAVMCVLVVFGPDAMTVLVEYMRAQFTGIAGVVR